MEDLLGKLIFYGIFLAAVFKLLKLDKYASIALNASIGIPMFIGLLGTIYIWISLVFYWLIGFLNLSEYIRILFSIVISLPFFIYIMLALTGTRFSKEMFSRDYLEAYLESIVETLNKKKEARRASANKSTHAGKLFDFSKQIQNADGDFIFYLIFAIAIYIFGYFLMLEVEYFEKFIWRLGSFYKYTFIFLTLLFFIFLYTKYYGRFTRIPHKEMMSLIKYLEDDGRKVFYMGRNHFYIQEKNTELELERETYHIFKGDNGQYYYWIESDMTFRQFTGLMLLSRHGLEHYYQSMVNKS